MSVNVSKDNTLPSTNAAAAPAETYVRAWHSVAHYYRCPLIHWHPPSPDLPCVGSPKPKSDSLVRVPDGFLSLQQNHLELMGTKMALKVTSSSNS